MIATKKEQRQAFKILMKNKALVGAPNMPFDKTTNYVGMLAETNAHRALHNAQPYQ
jgi:hypothetical protein